MPANIFQITGDKINSYEDFNSAVRNDNISNALYIPDNFSLQQGFDKYTRITFRAISFKNTNFERIKFVDCVFVSCIFLNSNFYRCEFSNCKFTDCNFLSSSWNKSRIDPKTLAKNFDYKKDANIATNLFHSLYEQYKKEHQPTYARHSKYLLMKARYGLNHYYKDKGDLGKIAFGVKKVQSILHCAISGYGVYKWRLIITFFLFLMMASILNHLLQELIFASGNPPESPNYSFIQSSYYTFISITTIGFGDMFPKTETGRVLTMVEASIGIILIASLLNFFSERD